MLEHPEITRTLTTGYPYSDDVIAVCSVCGQAVYLDETYGICGNQQVCPDCLERAWDRLNVREKFEALGFSAYVN